MVLIPLVSWNLQATKTNDSNHFERNNTLKAKLIKKTNDSMDVSISTSTMQRVKLEDIYYNILYIKKRYFTCSPGDIVATVST